MKNVRVEIQNSIDGNTELNRLENCQIRIRNLTEGDTPKGKHKTYEV